MWHVIFGTKCNIAMLKRMISYIGHGYQLKVKLTPKYSRTSLKQYCWDQGVGIELERLLNYAWSYTGPFKRWDRVQILTYGGY